MIKEISDIDQYLETATRAEMLELLEITEKYGLPTDGKFSVYVPNPIMWNFHASPAKTRLVAGGNRSGKTFSEMAEAASQFMGKAPASLKDIIFSFIFQCLLNNRIILKRD